MQEAEIYNAIRQEIISNNVLMHWFTFFVIIVLLIGCKIIENRKTVLSVFLPLIAPAWAASILRFDYFIHRQGAYLRALENRMQNNGFNSPLWETWKATHSSSIFIVPFADIIIFFAVIIPTGYILYNYTLNYFKEENWRFGKTYVLTVLLSTIILLLFLAFVPSITRF